MGRGLASQFRLNLGSDVNDDRHGPLEFYDIKKSAQRGVPNMERTSANASSFV